ncbi:hypothetical protein TGAM01_v204479 [Trichoderma gamsii]|uniref:Uncharacterized protein n=1 Tax=Trichoderma gamsii TaxID=398673 RepID=A0A2P4ZQ88_9HYPO|nr:hypothetical protein TGAM01_v204479 [Trichoderma gamsii]PON26469.1 hypothetical protein TGAM01_v204479 [Trichoderma gamsii]
MFYTISYNNSSAEVDSVSKMASNHTFGECRQSRLACIECRARKTNAPLTPEPTGQMLWRKHRLPAMSRDRYYMRLSRENKAWHQETKELGSLRQSQQLKEQLRQRDEPQQWR